MNNIFGISVVLLCLLLTYSPSFAGNEVDEFMPADHRKIDEPINYDQMKDFLGQLAGHTFIDVETIGQSVGGRDLFVVKLDHKKSPDPWRVFFFAQQHGDETAGKDALLYLIRRITQEPDFLPDDVALWIIPTVNPDGAALAQRRNKNDADLNRDHQLLDQPETKALYTTFRLFIPHVSVDCHEFRRDSEDFTSRGWLEWPIIMMGTANNPLFHPEIVKAGLRWIEHVAPFMEKKGHNFMRYHVGGAPPDNEQRFSSPEVDDARNGLASYGGLSFIIESGVKRATENESNGLGERIDAYLDLLTQFIHDEDFRSEGRRIVAASRTDHLPDFIPTNYFWGSLGQKITPVKVIDRQTGTTQSITTANFMTDMIIKRNVTTPVAYAIEAKNANIFRSLLQKHKINYEVLPLTQNLMAQGVELIGYEEQEDEVYNRYAGRQIVKQRDPVNKTFAAGSILVHLDNHDGIRSILLLEPNMMYGIYSSEAYRQLVDEQHTLPVWRIIE